MERIIDVAEYIIKKYRDMAGLSIDEMKLHKLLYFVQRESLALTNEPMFAESFEGWKYGPVSPIVRSKFTPDGIHDDHLDELSLENKRIVNNVLAEFADVETWKLSQLSHQETSWLNSRKGLDQNAAGTRQLSIEDIREDAKKVRPYDSVWDMYYDEFEDLEEA